MNMILIIATLPILALHIAIKFRRIFNSEICRFLESLIEGQI